MTRFLLLFLLNTIHPIVMAQNSTEASQYYTNLNRAELIQLANDAIALKYPDFKFDTKDYKITAWKNSEKTVVKYKRIIQFIPLGRARDNLRYDVEVDLTNQHISPFDTWGMENFYIPTREEQEKINFVVQAFGVERFSHKNSIKEDADMYVIHVSSKAAFGKYFIDKLTGKECMGAIESSYIQKPLIPNLTNVDPMVEIRE
ncbi:hypothetical protein Q4566_14590 [Tamlana sp. 2_MG-2023]|uniref:hypothetical protein n=1 Tax=unclassified Tamlana TaxID=2614803 RepID=UPI0026E3DA57|nr:MULTISPECIES: hypothetical protein [unclassified Tamlana]MDO6761437.1 hypothetical protein [Tamlana sp. 2_MG-2023]MDO6792119.1 hypothetical protein [Tamlana sp. 1_MG-2023]